MTLTGRGRAHLVASLLLLGAPYTEAGAAERPSPGADATQAVPTSAATPGQLTFAEGLRQLAAAEHDAARRHFEDALRLAEATGDTRLTAGCHRGLALVAAARGQQDVAVQEHRLARDLFIQVGDRAYAGASAQSLGTALYWLGHRDEAREAWQVALEDYAAVDDRAQQAAVLYNLAFVAASTDEKRQLLDRGLTLAEATGNRPLEGQLLAARSDLAFTQGDYRGAYDDLQRGVAVLREAGSGARKGLAHAYTSLGRLYRAHAQFEAAIAAYECAMAISRDLGDLVAQAQAMRAIAIAYQYLGNQELRARFLEQSLELLRGTQAINEQYFAEVHLASCMVDAGDHRSALTILDRIVETDWGRDSEWAQNTLARARVAAGDAVGAIEPATRAVDLSRKGDDVERLFHGLQVRAQVYMALARHEEALADLREALELVERLRQRLVPHDYMKRGFMDRFTVVFGLAIETLEALGRHAEAVEVTEQGRARAFADLLVARRVQRQPEPLPVGAGAVAPPHGPSVGTGASATHRGMSTTRGGSSARPSESGDDLPSDAAASPAAFADLARAAAASGATILSYWVDAHTTWAWVITPGGRVTSARTNVPRTDLQDLVRRVWDTRATAAVRVGGTPRDRPLPRRATRALHELLIAPVGDALSSAGTHRLVVIPHGPLLALSFAALQDERGRYLVEDYAVTYVTAGWMLGAGAPDASPSIPMRYLLIGAPATLPTGDDATRLTPLPGARRELARVAGRLTVTQMVRVSGAAASEARFRIEAPRADVLHVATHGVMLEGAPLDSFIALDASGPRGSRANDGRLTAREVYDLDLRARLVVLSACRSGMGRASGDGLFSLARAFFYAGAGTVVATLWDVADEPAAHLMPRFHRLVASGAHASEALRASQLALLRDLRAGRVVVQGPRGPVPLPEHPSLWAGFVAIGQP